MSNVRYLALCAAFLSWSTSATSRPVEWRFDQRRCMAFNTASDGAPSVLLEAHGDKLTLHALREGDMDVSAKETIAIIAKLAKCEAEWERYWADWRKRHPGQEP